MDEGAALEDMGLTHAESKVYIALLKLGSTTIGPIIRQSGLHNSLQRLFEKGLAAHTTKGRVNYFAASDPKRLVDILKEKEEVMDQALPRLKGMMNSSRNSQKVFIYEGANASRLMFGDILDTLKRGDEQLVAIVSKYDVFRTEFIKRWDEKRVASGIRKRLLLTEDAKDWIRFYRNRPLTRIRVLPNSFGTKTMIMDIFGDKTVITIWERVHIQIVDAEITDGFRKNFEFLWAAAKRP